MLADPRFNTDMQWNSIDNDIPRKRMFQSLANRRVIRFPHDRAYRYRREVDVSATEFDFDLVFAARFDTEYPAALLVLLGMAFIQNDAVAGFEASGFLKIDNQTARRDAPNRADSNPP